jgi:hypothetical protein
MRFTNKHCVIGSNLDVSDQLLSIRKVYYEENRDPIGYIVPQPADLFSIVDTRGARRGRSSSLPPTKPGRCGPS